MLSGRYVNGAERYEVAYGFMPCSTAAARANVLKVEPACRWALVAKLNWFALFPGATAVMARMAPFRGSIETTDEAGSPFSFRICLIAALAAFWKCGLIVV